VEYTDPKVPEEKKKELAQVMQDHMSKEDRVKFMKTVKDSYQEEAVTKRNTQIASQQIC